MQINIKHNFNLDKVIKRVERQMPNLLNDQMGIIKVDVEAGIRKGKDIDGKRFKKLKPATQLTQSVKRKAHTQAEPSMTQEQ